MTEIMFKNVSDSNGKTIATYKKPKFSKKCKSFTVNKIKYTIPKKYVKKTVDFTKGNINWQNDYVYNYRY